LEGVYRLGRGTVKELGTGPREEVPVEVPVVGIRRITDMEWYYNSENQPFIMTNPYYTPGFIQNLIRALKPNCVRSTTVRARD
jgi:hypothetical protein